MPSCASLKPTLSVSCPFFSYLFFSSTVMSADLYDTFPSYTIKMDAMLPDTLLLCVARVLENIYIFAFKYMVVEHLYKLLTLTVFHILGFRT